MLISILDLETTGLDPGTDEVIEVGAVLYCTKHRAIVQQVSTLFAVQENQAQDVNGISVELSKQVVRADLSVDVIDCMITESAYIVAFNSDFDESFASCLELTDRPWSDAAAIRYPKPSNSRSLIALCVAHGIPVVSAHRALDDCRLLAALLGTVPDLDTEIVRAARPRVLVQALVDYGDRQLAKDHGFRWDGAQKMWLKKMAPEDISELPFRAVEVEEF
jgi:DNA polymerase-3 subunit epsilon